MRAHIRLTIWVTFFAIAMGFLESAVVVYLRELYYPEGFAFPLQPIDAHVAITEILREAATLIMLVGIGYLAGKTPTQRFGWFIYTFGIWDIFYYVFLKLILGWPESLLTWDILFLIPTTWVGPVIAPVILSLTMILLAQLIAIFSLHHPRVYIAKTEWILLILGSLVVIFSFTLEYNQYVFSRYTFGELFDTEKRTAILQFAGNYIPQQFPWLIFGLGELLILAGIGRFAFWYWRR